MDTRHQAEAVRVYYRFEEIDGEQIDTDGHVAMAPSSSCLNVLNADDARPGFWRRQFGEKVTPAQRRFDWTFGFVLPLICFYFDPIVFRSDPDFGHAVLRKYQIVAYFAGFVTTMVLVAWLLWRDRLGSASLVPASVLSIGSMISLLIGLAIFPYSLIGAIFGIGLLGFTPLFTAVVYGRNAVRAFRTAARS